MKLLLLLLVAAFPCAAQFRSMEIYFQGIGCVSCVESLPSRVNRLRGIESAEVDAGKSLLKIQLAAQNRVRLEQVRDMVQQDGTKVTKAVVHVKGELAQKGADWVLSPAGLPVTYQVHGSADAAPSAGVHLVQGEVAELSPASGSLVIRMTRLEKAE